MAEKVTLKQLGDRIEGFSEQHLETQRAAVVLGLSRSLPDLARRSPVDTGQYASSWDFTADEKKAIIGNFAPHAPIIEWGARPFTPPLQPLLAWAKRVLEDPSQPPDYSDAVWGLAIYTQKKIESEGMTPRHILKDSYNMLVSNIEKEFKRITYG